MNKVALSDYNSWITSLNINSYGYLNKINDLETISFTLGNLFNYKEVGIETLTDGSFTYTFKTLQSDNQAFTLMLLEPNQTPKTVNVYDSEYNKTTNLIESNDTSATTTSITNFLNYSINYSKLVDNAIFIMDDIGEQIGYYLYADTITINNNKYIICDYNFPTTNVGALKNKNFYYFNTYKINSNTDIVNEDRFSTLDSQYIFDNNHNLLTKKDLKENVLTDIHSIQSKNSVYATSYLDDRLNLAKQNWNTIYNPTTIDKIYYKSLRDFYSFGNNFTGMYNKLNETTIYQVPSTFPYVSQYSQLNYISTFKNWLTYDGYYIENYEYLPIRTAQFNWNNFSTTFQEELYQAIDNLIGVNANNNIDNYTFFKTRNNEYFQPNKYDWPYNYMIDTNTQELNREIILSNWVGFTDVTNILYSPKINLIGCSFDEPSNAFTSSDLSDLEPILNNIINVPLIAGSTTIVLVGLIMITLLFKLFKLVK